MQRGAKFYDALASELGVGRVMDFEGFIAWGAPGGGAGVSLIKPFNGKPASVGNEVMVALTANSKAQVHQLHEIALANGGAREGRPGPRGEQFYAAYFRDPDGNKLNAFLAP